MYTSLIALFIAIAQTAALLTRPTHSPLPIHHALCITTSSCGCHGHAPTLGRLSGLYTIYRWLVLDMITLHPF